MPRGHPWKATRAPSPPLDPPGVNIVFHGFRVRPKTLFSESTVCAYVSYIAWYIGRKLTPNVCGTLVLTYKPAPRSRSISTSVEFESETSSRRDTIPSVACVSATWKESLRLIGSPCKGPASWLFALMSSKERALASASAKNVSVRQLTFFYQRKLISHSDLQFCGCQ